MRKALVIVLGMALFWVNGPAQIAAAAPHERTLEPINLGDFGITTLSYSPIDSLLVFQQKLDAVKPDTLNLEEQERLEDNKNRLSILVDKHLDGMGEEKTLQHMDHARYTVESAQLHHMTPEILERLVRVLENAPPGEISSGMNINAAQSYVEKIQEAMQGVVLIHSKPLSMGSAVVSIKVSSTGQKSARKPVVLVTGFEPYSVFSKNVSGEIAQSLNGLTIDVQKQGRETAFQIIGRVLPVSFESSGSEIRRLIDEIKPSVLLMFGLSKHASKIKVEALAKNMRHAKDGPDADGKSPENEVVVEGAPQEIASNAPTKNLVQRLVSAGFPAVASQDAGTFVCNNTFFSGLDAVKKLTLRTLVSFVHMPIAQEHLKPEQTGQFSTLPLDTAKSAAGLLAQWLAHAATPSPPLSVAEKVKKPGIIGRLRAWLLLIFQAMEEVISEKLDGEFPKIEDANETLSEARKVGPGLAAGLEDLFRRIQAEAKEKNIEVGLELFMRVDAGRELLILDRIEKDGNISTKVVDELARILSREAPGYTLEIPVVVGPGLAKQVLLNFENVQVEANASRDIRSKIQSGKIRLKDIFQETGPRQDVRELGFAHNIHSLSMTAEVPSHFPLQKTSPMDAHFYAASPFSPFSIMADLNELAN